MTTQSHSIELAKQTETQKEGILNHLLLGLTLTGLEALELFGTMKLATRCSELKAEQWPILDEWIVTDSGKMVKRYYLYKR